MEKIKFGKLGVALEVAENRGNARDTREYEDDFKIPTIEWMEGEIAMAFRENEPILIEGGTGIGKTRTVERMCAQLGYELYKLPCSSSTTEREMMGRYVSNSERKSKLDPEVIFALGVIAEGLKEEPGKIKVIYLDEINAMDGAVGARLHDILDEAKKEKVKGRVKLVEDAGEVLEFDPKRVKIVATMNSADSKNTHAQKLSEALLRRFTYKRTVDELPDVEFLSIALQKFQSNEILKDLPGISDEGELIKAYSECHKALQGLKRNNQIGVGVAQDFKFEDIDYLKRVIKKVAVFWEDGIFTDLPSAFREAVKIVYTGMIVDPTERKMMEEQISKLDFKPVEDPNRKGLDDRRKAKKLAEEAERKKKEEAEALKAKTELGRAELALEEIKKKEAKLKMALRKGKKELSGETAEAEEISVEYKRKDTKGKEKSETISLNFEKELTDWTDFYTKHGIELPADFAEQMQDIWNRNADVITEAIKEKGFNNVLFIPDGLPSLSILDEKMTEGYEKAKGNKTYWEMKKEEITEKRSGGRIILLHDSIEPDDIPELAVTLGKTAQSFLDAKEELTVSEYLLLQREIFEKTGKHIDDKRTSWVPGARVGSGVVRACWGPDGAQVGVNSGAPGDSFSDIGCRLSRCFK